VAQQRTAESRDMTLLGSNDLQARSAYQPVIQKQGNRYIAYIGPSRRLDAQHADRQDGGQRDVGR
jgi:hypothetical protein